MTPEGKVKKFAKDRLSKELGKNVWIYMPPGGRFGRAGTPDLIGLCQGVFFAIEFKADESCKLTPLQEQSIKQIAQAGGVADVLKGRDEIKLNSIIAAIRSKANHDSSI